MGSKSNVVVPPSGANGEVVDVGVKVIAWAGKAASESDAADARRGIDNRGVGVTGYRQILGKRDGIGTWAGKIVRVPHPGQRVPCLPCIERGVSLWIRITVTGTRRTVDGLKPQSVTRVQRKRQKRKLRTVECCMRKCCNPGLSDRQSSFPRNQHCGTARIGRHRRRVSLNGHCRRRVEELLVQSRNHPCRIRCPVSRNHRSCKWSNHSCCQE